MAASSGKSATLRFVFFPNEEPPFFQTEHMGSLVYARSCRERNEDVTAVEEEATTHGGVAFPYAATLELEVRGKKVAKPVAARYQLADGTLTVEAVGAFRFTDFGIEPYSAFFGAVKNEDEFHAFVSLTGFLNPPATR